MIVQTIPALDSASHGTVTGIVVVVVAVDPYVLYITDIENLLLTYTTVLYCMWVLSVHNTAFLPISTVHLNNSYLPQ